MSSVFAWVDFDEASRRRMLDVIDKFRDQDTVDELGIGTIRDAFANYFFPGTSTIMTRARYFLFIPWIYHRLEEKKVPSSKISTVARDAEFQLIEELTDAGLGENEGIIGRISRRKLQRLPSNIYWVGLYQWGIRRRPGTQELYHKYLDSYYKIKDNRLVTDDKEPLDSNTAFNWDPHIPAPPKGFPKGATMELRREEARYLQNRIAEFHGESLLSAIINAPSFYHAHYFWESELLIKDLPLVLRNIIGHARNFAQTMHGAVLLYNLMLAQAQKNQELADGYMADIEKWASGITERKNDIAAWYSNINEFWNNDALKPANIPYLTKQFVETWCSIVYQRSSPKGIADNNEARELVKLREARLKKNRARLQYSRYLELWNGTSGAAMLEYRWRQVSRIVQDIRKGLGDEKCLNQKID